MRDGQRCRFAHGHNRTRTTGPTSADYSIEDRGHSTACWIWRGKPNGAGYGRASVNRRVVLAHRVMYELHVGPIPVGLELDHLCRNRACVNPAHLEPVTHEENVRRGAAQKLTPDEVDAIRVARRTGETMPSIGKRFGVSTFRVYELTKDLRRTA